MDATLEADFSPIVVYPSHYLEVVDNFNKEKVVAANKITRITFIIETTKITNSKIFPLFWRQYLLRIYIYRDNIY